MFRAHLLGKWNIAYPTIEENILERFVLSENAFFL